MIVFRITHPDYAHDLSGIGASIHGARWNERGLPVLYTAQSSSLAILEFLVHIKGVKGNLSYKLLTLDARTEDIEKVKNLTVDWSTNVQLTQSVGTEWLKSKRTVALKVPSVHNPLEHNILLNPRHPDFNPVTQRADWYWYDGRLIQLK